MAWVLLDGIDRSGKSTVAEIYKKQGYEIVHMSAPDKKYSQPGYSGPSYLEEIVDMYNAYAGKDVLFDRSIWGEKIWPEVYNRQPQLNEEDLEYLQKIEYNNNAAKYLMYDKDVEAHWQRCVDNKEPLNRLQFKHAIRLYDELAMKYNFEKKQLSDFDTVSVVKEEPKVEISKNIEDTKTHKTNSVKKNTLESKLERANAIRSLLKSPIVKKKGEAFKELESSIKGFLEQELENIFKEERKEEFTQDEVQILKIYASRIKEKLG